MNRHEICLPLTKPPFRTGCASISVRFAADDIVDFPHFDPQQVKVLMLGDDAKDDRYVLDEGTLIADMQCFRVLNALVTPVDSIDEINLSYFYSYIGRDGIYYCAADKVSTAPLQISVQITSGSTRLLSNDALQAFYSVVKKSDDCLGRSR